MGGVALISAPRGGSKLLTLDLGGAWADASRSQLECCNNLWQAAAAAVAAAAKCFPPSRPVSPATQGRTAHAQPSWPAKVCAVRSFEACRTPSTPLLHPSPQAPPPLPHTPPN